MKLADHPAKSQVEKFIRKNYLISKGINPNLPHQLDLIFPEVIGKRDDQRFLPNDYARSSLFTARNKREPRLYLENEKLFHYNEHISLIYTGMELRAEDDEIICLQIFHYGKDSPLGNSFEFSIHDLVRDVGWSKNGRYYDKARECIRRLKSNEVLIHNSKAYGKSGAISLILKYEVVNDSTGKPTNFRVWLDPNIIVLFAGNTFTSHAWLAYRKLSPVARRLADHVESHRHPFDLAIERFKGMCGSKDSSLASWRQTVDRACKELEAEGIAKLIKLIDGKITCFQI